MTGSDAAKILQKPVFGSQNCIDAIQVLHMAEALLGARKWARRRELSTPEMKTHAVALMELDDVAEELDFWYGLGWGPE